MTTFRDGRVAAASPGETVRAVKLMKESEQSPSSGAAGERRNRRVCGGAFLKWQENKTTHTAGQQLSERPRPLRHDRPGRPHLAQRRPPRAPRRRAETSAEGRRLKRRVVQRVGVRVRV